VYVITAMPLPKKCGAVMKVSHSVVTDADAWKERKMFINYGVRDARSMWTPNVTGTI
jgi:hypothetical protein